jgi:hypothetical protein
MYPLSVYCRNNAKAKPFDENVPKQRVYHNVRVGSGGAEKGIQFGELPTHNRGVADFVVAWQGRIIPGDRAQRRSGSREQETEVESRMMERRRK